MTFQEIYAQVVSLTNHPELVNEITSAIQAATLRMHQADYYERDVAEALVALPQSDYYHQFDVRSTFARWRHFKYLRKWDKNGQDPLSQQNTGAAGTFFKFLDPDNILDGYSVHKRNICYVAGSNLNLRSDSPIQMLLAGWYQNPIVQPTANFTSWIAEQVPFAIIFDAVSIIFQMLAFQDQSRKFDALVAEQVGQVKMIGLSLKGY